MGGDEERREKEREETGGSMCGVKIHVIKEKELCESERGREREFKRSIMATSECALMIDD